MGVDLLSKAVYTLLTILQLHQAMKAERRNTRFARLNQ